MLISVASLAAQLPEVLLLDASWFMPGSTRNPAAEYHAQRIPGARYFDPDGIKDFENPLPHMLPTEAAFAAACDALGIRAEHTVVVYDALGCYSAARVWWMFRIFGHLRVFVLDGGLPAWRAAGFALETDPPLLPADTGVRAALRGGATNYPATLNPSLLRSLEQVQHRAVWARAEQVVDARSAGRFEGTAPEPRAGLRGGHMPHARNIPFTTLLTEEGRMRGREELAAVFAEAGVDLSDPRPLVASCGSGMTAGVVALAAAVLGREDVAIYDGSWTEWGGREDVEVVRGNAS